jgi:lipid-A-disaccharide synthase-like uncharacterized protein
VHALEETELPWSYYALIGTFGLFFFSLNMYIFTEWLQHPLQSPLWLIPTVGGFIGLVYSARMVKNHQSELVSQQSGQED